MTRQLHFKDKILDELANKGNVAQFVSFSPDCAQRYSRIVGTNPNQKYPTAHEALSALLQHSPEKKINLRSFRPEAPQGNEFFYGLDHVDSAASALQTLSAKGLFVIANETVDLKDGGVSGVAQGGIIEFAPGATPRVVETGNVMSLNIEVGLEMLRRVYGFQPEIPDTSGCRVEFSVHPVKRGYRRTNTILWELEGVEPVGMRATSRWPNDFSRFIGDKTFGLLMSDCLGMKVPSTLALCRNIHPFRFGQPTGSDMKWLRTSPTIPEPGMFPTVRGWTDPFSLMNDHSLSQKIASLLIQDEVPAEYSGALITGSDGLPVIEGVKGFGDLMMLGNAAPGELPNTLISDLTQLHTRVASQLGSIRAEWAFDGEQIWILQLQQELAISSGSTIVPGDAEEEVEFDVRRGLDELRRLVDQVKEGNCGIVLVGNLGMTSHMADLLRRSGVPSRFSAPRISSTNSASTTVCSPESS